MHLVNISIKTRIASYKIKELYENLREDYTIEQLRILDYGGIHILFDRLP